MFQQFLTDNMSTILALIMLTLSYRLFFRRPKNIPPGPWLTLPLIGNLIQVNTNPVKSFRRMRKQYGDVFGVYFANRLIIAINGLESLTDAFVKNSEVFSDRPDVFMINLLSRNRGILGSNGEVWKEQRKLSVNTLKNLGMGKNILEGNIQEEITAFTGELVKSNGKVIDARELISTSVSNVISALVFGRRFEFEDKGFIKFLKIVDDTIGTPPVLTFFPFLKYLPGDMFKFKHLRENIDLILRQLIEPSLKEHMAQYDENSTDDLISSYIKEMKKKEKLGDTKSSINRDNMRVTIWNLFIAGSETTATAIRWLLLLYLHFPEIQDKCFAEIEEKVGDRPISLQDKIELPYLDATIMETLRFADIAPLAAMRCVSEETVFKGYRIPKDAIILPVLDSVLSDPKIWGDPENFRPERFIDANGRFTKPDEHIPFSLGPRKCLGEALARMELFLFIATLTQKFKFIKPEGFVLPNLDGRFGFVHTPHPYKMRAVLRKV